MRDNHKVAVIIITENSVDTIDQAIESVSKGLRPADRIIIVDNDSKDNTYEHLCERLGIEEVEINGNRGLPPTAEGTINESKISIHRSRKEVKAKLMNYAVRQHFSEEFTIFCFMEPDSWYSADKIINAISIFNKHQSVACVVSDWDNHHEDGITERVFKTSFDMQRLMSTYPYDGNFILRSAVLPKLNGGFREDMPIRSEYELLLRLSEVGLIYHVPAPLHHNKVRSHTPEIESFIAQLESMAIQITNQRRGKPNG